MKLSFKNKGKIKTVFSLFFFFQKGEFLTNIHLKNKDEFRIGKNEERSEMQDGVMY